jgi:methyl-accepting chemotaxis protein
MAGVSENSDAVSGSIESIVGSVSGIRAGLIDLTRTSTDNAGDLQRLSRMLAGVSDDTNVLLQHLAETGVEIPDSPYIDFAMAAAAAIARQVDADIDAGHISLAAFFSDDYRSIPVQAEPKMYDHPATPLLVAAARPHQEAARALRGFFGLTLTDRNTFAAVAMPERSQPRSADPAWNAEHSRHMQIFGNPEQYEQCGIQQPFLLKAYRRPLASGGVVLLKQVIVSVRIKGRHWGISQLAYQDQR